MHFKSVIYASWRVQIRKYCSILDISHLEFYIKKILSVQWNRQRVFGDRAAPRIRNSSLSRENGVLWQRLKRTRLALDKGYKLLSYRNIQSSCRSQETSKQRCWLQELDGSRFRNSCTLFKYRPFSGSYNNYLQIWSM